ncbi:hypothetical protein H072_4595 [Dactylellina haptotyla CBS 200.50]|uniref:Potassium channel domain-containing protein n=1 Tax=Dactylellina haptotyla (strain CBS 200.50) TaxID=1284197 RepID=S8AJZ9_DACHA|nr:hypothetical protein H072_4595 [Dactylellina haptotyla CBS 200.50]
MNHIRLQLLGEAINRTSSRNSIRPSRPTTPASTPQPAEDPMPNTSLDGEKSSEPSSSKSAGMDTDNDNELANQPNNDDPDETDARLEEYADEFEQNDEPPMKWWFAAKGIPLVAATVGPLANLTSVAALVSPWRANLDIDGDHAFDQRFDNPFADPKWAIGINAASLVFGFVGNFFLMCNYSRRIRYAVAMPFTIICWYIAFGLLSSILIALHVYARPVSPTQVYTQAFWFGVISAGLYLFAATILFVNIAGFLKRHYPAHIESSRAEKNLMLQTIFFFAWLGIGALIFCKIEGWSYSDSVYFCNVTLLTVGFGDIAATSDAARGFVFPFSVIGIIMLGLVVNSIHGFVIEIGEKQVVGQHITHRRQDVANRAVATSSELHRGDPTLTEFVQPPPDDDALSPTTIRFADTPITPRFDSPSTNRFGSVSTQGLRHASSTRSVSSINGLRHTNSIRSIPKQLIAAVTRKRRSRPILLRASRDRFEAMRKIQRHTLKFKQWTALVSSSVAFLTLWLLGAVIFMIAERETQHLTYFQALYFCYVSLLTIGYGDLSPRSNAGKAFFLLWSIWSVPTITILISSMGSTVIERFQNATLRLAEFTLLPKEGIRESLQETYKRWKQERTGKKHDNDEKSRPRSSYAASAMSGRSNTSSPSAARRSSLGGIQEQDERPRSQRIPIFQISDDSDPEQQRQQVDEADGQQEENLKILPEDYTFQELLMALAAAIRDVGRQVCIDPKRAYDYEDWVEFTRLIRACELVKPHRLKGVKPGEEIPRDNIDNEEGFVLWDWIGEDSPLLYEGREPAWVQDRLTRGLERLVQEHHSSISLRPPRF